MNALEEYERHVGNHDRHGHSDRVSRALADAAIESLKCCGSCKWCGSVEYLNCTHDDVPERERGEFYVSLDDRCHFTPSRWTERTP